MGRGLLGTADKSEEKWQSKVTMPEANLNGVKPSIGRVVSFDGLQR